MAVNANVIELLIGMAHHAKTEGRFEDASHRLNIALQHVGNDMDKAKILIQRAYLHCEKGGDFRVAVSDYARALKLNPDLMSADLENSLLSLFVGEPAVENRELAQTEGTEIDDSMVFVPASLEYSSYTEDSDTTSASEKPAESFMTDRFFLALRGDLVGRQKFDEGNTDAAKEIFQQVITSYSILLGEKEPTLVTIAKKLLLKLLGKKEPTKELLRNRRAQLYLATEQPEKALEDCITLLKLDPHRADHYFHKAEAKIMMRHPEALDEALNDLDLALKFAPRRHRISQLAHERKGYLFLLGRRYKDAINAFNNAMSSAHDEERPPTLLLQLALAHYLDTDYPNVLLVIEEITETLDSLDDKIQPKIQSKIDIIKARLSRELEEYSPPEGDEETLRHLLAHHLTDDDASTRKARCGISLSLLTAILELRLRQRQQHIAR